METAVSAAARRAAPSRVLRRVVASPPIQTPRVGERAKDGRMARRYRVSRVVGDGAVCSTIGSLSALPRRPSSRR